MLILNVKRLFALRMIERPYTILVKHGFSAQVASNIINNNAGSLKTKHIQILCTILNCTPSDLFEWRDSAKSTISDGHALRTLKREPQDQLTNQIIHNLPVEKLEKLNELLNTSDDDQVNNPLR